MIEKRGNILISVIIIFILGCIIFGLNKGIDLTDEGLYLALSSPFEKNYFSQFNYSILFTIIYDLSGFTFDLIDLRILKIFLLGFSIILFIPVFRYFKLKIFQQLFIIVGITSHYAYFGQSLSYNTLAFFFWICFLTTGFYYFFIKKVSLLFLLLGLFGGASFLAKSTIGLLVLPFGMLFVLCDYFESNKVKISLIHLFLFVFGYFGLHLIFNFLYPAYNWAEVVLNGVELSSYNSTHNKISILKYPLSALRWIFILMTSGFFLSKGINTNEVLNRIIFFTISIFLLFYFFLSHTDINTYKFFEYIFLLLSYFYIGFIVEDVRLKSIDFREIIFTLILLVSPLIVSFGTISYHFKGGVLYLFFHFLIISIITIKGSKILRIYFYYFSIFISLLLSYKIFLNIIYSPFKQPSLLGEMLPITYFTNSEILVPEPYAIYLKDLKNSFDRNVPEDKNVLGFYEMPGDILLAGRYNEINPCLWEEYQWGFYKSKSLKAGIFEEEHYLLLKSHYDLEKLGFRYTLILDSLVHYSGQPLYLIKAIH